MVAEVTFVSLINGDEDAEVYTGPNTMGQNKEQGYQRRV